VVRDVPLEIRVRGERRRTIRGSLLLVPLSRSVFSDGNPSRPRTPELQRPMDWVSQRTTARVIRSELESIIATRAKGGFNISEQEAHLRLCCCHLKVIVIAGPNAQPNRYQGV